MFTILINLDLLCKEIVLHTHSLMYNSINIPIFLDKGLMSKEQYVLEVVVSFVLALGLPVWLTWMYSLHDAQFPAG